MRTTAKTILAFLVISFAAAAPAAADKDHKVDSLLTYKLGQSYDELSKRAKYQDDPERDRDGLKVGKIIDFFGAHPAVQRLYFKDGKLVRVQVIYGDQKVTEDTAKDVVAKAWGDPGPKKDIGKIKAYAWMGSIGLIMIVPAAEGRTMIVLAQRDAH